MSNFSSVSQGSWPKAFLSRISLFTLIRYSRYYTLIVGTAVERLQRRVNAVTVSEHQMSSLALRFTPGAALQTEKKTGPSAADVEAIKNAIANATSLAEVERLKGFLQSGQIPGRELRSGASDMVEEEEEEVQEEMQESVPMFEDMEGAEGENPNHEDMQEDVHMNGS